MTAIDWLARLYPWPVRTSDELTRALAFLDWAHRPAEVVRGGYGAAGLVGLATAAFVVVAPARYRLPAGLAGVAIALAVAHAVHAAPRLLATAQRTSALGTAPELLVLAVLRMRLSPSPERAADFAAETGTGRLAESLAGHVDRARGSNGTGLRTFGEEWDEWFPALGRGLGLVAAAGAVDAAERGRALDRAMSVVLDGTRRQMQDFAGSIRGPATGLYAFGVLLPTALVALLPAARAAGLAVTPLAVATVYDVGLPLLLFAAGAWLLARRPVAVPPPRLGPDHPEVAERRVLAVVAALGAAGSGALVTALAFPWWAPPIAAVGFGTGTWLTVRHRSAVAVAAEIRDVERDLTDALSVIGRRVAHGEAVERAIASAAADLDGATAAVFARGARKQRQLDVGVRSAFLGEHGVLQTVPSPRVRGSVELLALAAHEGQPAGQAILSMAGHLDDLRDVERAAREDVRTVVETLRSTGAVFGPLVGGATVALAERMGAGGAALPGATEPMTWLGLVVGAYALLLATLLTAIATGLERGFDRRLLGYRIGIALLSGTATFLCGYLGAAAVA